MAEIKFTDDADQFRIELSGPFAGSCVSDVEARWQQVLRDTGGRKITLDITHMAGYDVAGRRTLRRMHRHGVVFAAGTPESLAHLADITAPALRGPLPAIRNNASDTTRGGSRSSFSSKSAAGGS